MSDVATSNTSEALTRIEEATRHIRERARTVPTIGVVLGSGLGAWADDLENVVKLPYREIPHLPASTILGHAGNLCIGHSRGVSVACLQGRVHLYEGHGPERVVFGVRLLARLGCKAVLLTNAAGGTNSAFRPGDLMLISDHINLTGQNPLVGPNEEAFGTRFPDMTAAYDPELRALAKRASASTNTPLHEGVYAQLIGPSYETPAEISYLRNLGADAVGMSTALEVIALRHMRVRAAAMSCITNLAAGMSRDPLSHDEVEATARAARSGFVALLSEWVSLAGADFARG